MLHLLLEALGIATGCAATNVGWRSSRYSESTPAIGFTAYNSPNWDISGEVSSKAHRTRTKRTVRTLKTIAALLALGATAFGVAATQSDSRIALVIAMASAGCCLAGGFARYLSHRYALRLSRARETFDCFYVGTGLHKYEQLEPVLARFARENPTAHRIAVCSILADQKAGAAEHERQMDACVKAMNRALA